MKFTGSSNIFTRPINNFKPLRCWVDHESSNHLFLTRHKWRSLQRLMHLLTSSAICCEHCGRQDTPLFENLTRNWFWNETSELVVFAQFVTVINAWSTRDLHEDHLRTVKMLFDILIVDSKSSHRVPYEVLLSYRVACCTKFSLGFKCGCLRF